MKKTQRKEIQEKTLAELVADGRNWRQEIFNLRLQQASAQLEKPARLRTLRKDIARIETRMSELKDMTLTELNAKSRDLRQEMFNLRLQQSSSQLEKPARLRLLRKDIARVETRISQLRTPSKPAAAAA